MVMAHGAAPSSSARFLTPQVLHVCIHCRCMCMYVHMHAPICMHTLSQERELIKSSTSRAGYSSALLTRFAKPANDVAEAMDGCACFQLLSYLSHPPRPYSPPSETPHRPTPRRAMASLARYLEPYAKELLQSYEKSSMFDPANHLVLEALLNNLTEQDMITLYARNANGRFMVRGRRKSPRHPPLLSYSHT